MLRGAAILFAVLAACPGLAQGQDPGARRPAPLSKSDLTRLLSGGTYTRPEVVAIVQRSCLSFEPSARDLADLRQLGADATILAAIDACASPPPTPAEPTPLLISLSTPRLAARVGGTATLTVQLRGPEGPRAGVQLVLRGTENIPGGLASTMRATTDAQGQARFRVPAGTGAASHSLVVTAVGESLTGPVGVVLDVAAGSPARVEVEPDRLVLPDEPTGTLEVSAVAFDRYGNRVPNAVLTLRARATSRGLVGTPPPVQESTRTADASGTVLFTVPATAELARYVLEVQSDGLTLASLPVMPSPVTAIAEAPEPEEQGPPTAGDPEEAAPDPADERQPQIEQAVEEAGETAAIVLQRKQLAAEALASGDAEGALRLYQGAVSLDPDDAEAWFELGRAWAAAGEMDEARAAFRRALELDPELSEQVDAQLASLPSLPPWLQLDIWGGTAIETGETTGTIMVEASIWPFPFLRIWGRYDNALGLHNPLFVRRTQDLESYFGGLALAWGQDRRLITSFEAGRRNQAGDLFEYVYHGEQAVKLTQGRGEIAFGGYLGRWFDRDDWVGYGRADIQASDRFAVRPAVYFGETVTVLDDRRIAESEVRGYLGFAYRPVGPLEIEPVFGYGSVESQSDDLSGSLLEGQFRLSADLGASSRFQIFVRHQRPPGGSESFTTLAAGLVLGIDRSVGGGGQP
jgi:tetratricopeptide (TPR) repeat protein